MNILEKLCWYDNRNPMYLVPDYEDEIIEPRRPDYCGCDNCYYGCDQLALRVIQCREALQAVLEYCYGVWEFSPDVLEKVVTALEEKD